VDGNTLPVRGVVGLIKWGYFNAAAINGYTVRYGRDGHHMVTGTVVNSDKFKMSQKPLMFVAPHAGGAWVWDILDLEIRDGAFTARLGAQIKPGMIVGLGR